MSRIRDEIVDRIRRNRISTTEVADCMEKSGVLSGVTPLNPGMHRVGPVFWTYACHDSNWELHEQLQNVPEHCIVVTDAFHCDGRALYGELVAKYLILYRQVTALVCCGLVRDASALRRENWPIWQQGVTPIGCYNRRATQPLDMAAIAARREKLDGAVCVCDDGGAVIIPAALHTQEFLEKLDWIEEQEDIWFDCIDRRKWNTFETVCLKKYLEEPTE